MGAAGASDEYSCEFGSQKYFALCAFGGVLSCGITHTMVTPLDLVKCRLQVDKEKYKNLGNGFKLTMQEGGLSGLFLGWAPTAIGYSAQGLCKFGFYEVFKKVYGDAMGEENAYLYPAKAENDEEESKQQTDDPTGNKNAKKEKK